MLITTFLWDNLAERYCLGYKVLWDDTFVNWKQQLIRAYERKKVIFSSTQTLDVDTSCSIQMISVNQ